MLKTIITRSVAVSMLMLIIAATGIYSTLEFPIELTPDVELPKVTVQTAWPNASPEMVEVFITSSIEGTCAALPGVRKVTSVSSAGQSQVTVEFAPDTRVDFATLQLSEQLGLVKEQLPHNAGLPRIEKYVPEEFRQEAFLSYQLSDPYSLYEVRRAALSHLQTPLLSVPGIADVQVRGGQKAEIHILLHRDVMQTMGISIAQVHAALAQLNLHTQAGSLPRGDRRLDLIVLNPLTTIAELKKLQFPVRETIVHLQDFAEIRRSFENVQHLVRIDGNPTVSLTILREPGQNAIKVADDVFARLHELVAGLLPGMKLLKSQDESERIRRDMRALGSRSLFCLLIILLVLFIFFHNYRLPLLVMATVFFRCCSP